MTIRIIGKSLFGKPYTAQPGRKPGKGKGHLADRMAHLVERGAEHGRKMMRIQDNAVRRQIGLPVKEEKSATKPEPHKFGVSDDLFTWSEKAQQPYGHEGYTRMTPTGKVEQIKAKGVKPRPLGGYDLNMDGIRAEARKIHRVLKEAGVRKGQWIRSSRVRGWGHTIEGYEIKVLGETKYGGQRRPGQRRGGWWQRKEPNGLLEIEYNTSDSFLARKQDRETIVNEGLDKTLKALETAGFKVSRQEDKVIVDLRAESHRGENDDI